LLKELGESEAAMSVGCGWMDRGFRGQRFLKDSFSQFLTFYLDFHRLKKHAM
jgi:hypothetical protein